MIGLGSIAGTYKNQRVLSYRINARKSYSYNARILLFYYKLVYLYMLVKWNYNASVHVLFTYYTVPRIPLLRGSARHRRRRRHRTNVGNSNVGQEPVIGRCDARLEENLRLTVTQLLQDL